MSTFFGQPPEAFSSPVGVVVTLTGNATLTGQNYNKTHRVQAAAGCTITLPTVASGLASDKLTFVNDSPTGVVSVVAQGSDYIRINGVNNISLPISPGDSCTVENAGGVFVLTNNSSQKVNSYSPAFTGTPTAPTAALGDSSSQIANTAFVQSAINRVIADSYFYGQL